MANVPSLEQSRTTQLAMMPAHRMQPPSKDQWLGYRQAQLDHYQADRLREHQIRSRMQSHIQASSRDMAQLAARHEAAEVSLRLLCESTPKSNEAN